MKPNEKNAVSIVQSHFHVVQVACVIIPQMVVGGVFGVCEMMSSGNTYIIQIWYKECLAVRLEPLSSPRNDSFPAPAGPQQIVSSSVLDGSQASQPHCSVFQTNNNRFYCWPCQYPLLLLWERGVGLAPFCCLTQTACAYLTSCLVAGSNWNPDSTLFFFIEVFPQSFPPNHPPYMKTTSLKTTSLFSPPLPNPAAWLGLHFRAGFQRTAVWSGHCPRLQDALSPTGGGGTLVPRWVQPLSTRGRQRHSHDPRRYERGVERKRGKKQQAKDQAGAAPLTI